MQRPHNNCNEGISSAPQLKNNKNNFTQTKQPVIAVKGLGIFPKVSFAYYFRYCFLVWQYHLTSSIISKKTIKNSAKIYQKDVQLNEVVALCPYLF